MVKNSTIVIIVLLGFFALVMMSLIGLLSLVMMGAGEPIQDGNVAIIPIKGVITGESMDGLFVENVASSKAIVNMIEKANEDSEIVAIIFEINSPGGSPVASEEIAAAIKETNKTTVAWIREVGASGAYWIASSCDTIIANRMSITGSIGVISSYLDFSGLINDHNVSYQRLVAGKYKDIGSPFRELSIEEEKILQGQLDKIHEFFIEEVANNRGLSIEETKIVANGLFYIGHDAKENGLVDILGGKREAVKYIEKKHGIVADPTSYSRKVGFFDKLAGVFNEYSFNIGRGIGFEIMKPKSESSRITYFA